MVGCNVASGALALPQLLLAEASNILRRSALTGAIAPEQASVAHGDLLDLRIELFPYAPLRIEVLGTSGVWELVWRLVRGNSGRLQRTARHPGAAAGQTTGTPCLFLLSEQSS